MKLSIAALFWLPAAVHGQQGKIFGCSFVKYFGSGSALSVSGTDDTFTVVAGAEVTCHTTCASGSSTTVSYSLGGDSDGETDSDCTMTTRWTATADRSSLSWSVSTSGDYDNLALSCYCSNDGSGVTIDDAEDAIDDLEDDIGCFSESATVEVKGQEEPVAMKDIKLGDVILTDKDKYQPVYSFGHRKPDSPMEFYQIYTDEDATPLEMTGNHMIMVLDNKGHTKATRTDVVQVGDRLLHVQTRKEVVVTAVHTAKKKGLYMPLTPNGKIVVNGLLASNYISISDEAPGVVSQSNWFFTYLAMPEQALSHWWLSPFRMLCMGVSSSYCSNGDEEVTAHLKAEEDNGILPWLLTGRKLAEVVELQHNLVQVIVFGFPTFLIFGFFNLVENLFLGPSLAPGLCVLTITALLFAKMKKNKKNKKGNTKEEDDELNEKLLVV